MSSFLYVIRKNLSGGNPCNNDPYINYNQHQCYEQPNHHDEVYICSPYQSRPSHNTSNFRQIENRPGFNSFETVHNDNNVLITTKTEIKATIGDCASYHSGSSSSSSSKNRDRNKNKKEKKQKKSGGGCCGRRRRNKSQPPLQQDAYTRVPPQEEYPRQPVPANYPRQPLPGDYAREPLQGGYPRRYDGYASDY